MTKNFYDKNFSTKKTCGRYYGAEALVEKGEKSNAICPKSDTICPKSDANCPKSDAVCQFQCRPTDFD